MNGKCVQNSASSVHNNPSNLFKVVDFGTVKSAYNTSYYSPVVAKVTLVLSCHVSEILELLYSESHFFDTPPYSG